MKKPEAEFYHSHVKPAFDSLAGTFVYSRHEDRVTPGTPDLDYACEGGGWIELKRIKAPRRQNGKAPIRHLTKQQVGFLHLRGAHGQGAWVLVMVDEGWNEVQTWAKPGSRKFYLWGYWQLSKLEAPGIRYVLWEDEATAMWEDKIDPYEFKQIVTGHTRGRRIPDVVKGYTTGDLRKATR